MNPYDPNDWIDPPIEFKCGEQVDDPYSPPDNFKYVGVDEHNNPMFECKKCGMVIYG